MSKFNKQDSVRLVRCADKYMQADRRNIGKHGIITDVIREGGMVYFEVTLANGSCDHVEAAGMDMLKRAQRATNKRDEVVYA